MANDNTEIDLLEDFKWVWHSEMDMSLFLESMPFIGGIAHGQRRSVKTFKPAVKVDGHWQDYEVCVIKRESGHKTVAAFPRLNPILDVTE